MTYDKSAKRINLVTERKIPILGGTNNAMQVMDYDVQFIKLNKEYLNYKVEWKVKNIYHLFLKNIN